MGVIFFVFLRKKIIFACFFCTASIRSRSLDRPLVPGLFFYLSHRNFFATLHYYDKAMLRNIVVFFLVLTGIIKHGAEMAISGGGHFGIYLVWYNKVSITYIVNFAIDMLHSTFSCFNYTLFWYIVSLL